MQKQQSMEYPVSRTFGVQAPDEIRVPGRDAPGPFTPPAKAGYAFRSGPLSDVLCWYRGLAAGQHHDGLWVTGPTGSGKTTLIEQVAARLNLNLIRANGRQRLEMADLIGHLTAVGGDVLFEDGPLTQAARHGAWFLLDEADLVHPGELAGLNTLLDGGPLVIAENGGEVVWPAPGFGILCSANTAGSGDASGIYAASQRLNGAFMDRFWVVSVAYPAAAEEEALLAKVYPELPPVIVRGMVEVANGVRKLFEGEGEEPKVELTFSTRTLLRWAYLVLQYRAADKPLHHALKRALTNRAEPETAQAIDGIVQRIFAEG